MSKYDVVIKKVDALKVVSLRAIVPTPPDQGNLWRELDGYMAMHHARSSEPCLSLYHDDEYKERDWEIEVCEPLAADISSNRRITVRVLPAVDTMACTIHHGPFVTIGEAYNALMRWIDENGYHITGPMREVYLKPARHGSQTDPGTVTEIQAPVEKA